MDNFRDLPALHGLVHSAYRNCTDEERHAKFVDTLKEVLGFTTEQAELYTSTVLGQNAPSFADCVLTNGSRVIGSWVRGEQEGNVGSWLSTMKETWQFNNDLTYEHKVERYDSSITAGPFFQSSYSSPKINLERGIWAPPDTMLDELKLFVMSTDGVARCITFQWVEKETYNYRSCSINGTRFGRE
ncbi:MAG TPA: hypothetical protein VFX07_07090 [Candidatus Udaeobacter sp.]|jgi:hypothetical protein|nr:hypothetical protein [Candidatus Udaeobacter sp.]